MRKIDYILLKIQKRNEERDGWGKNKNTYSDYFDKRMDHRDPYIKPPMHACRDCNFTAKRRMGKCPRCGSENIYNVGYCAKPPRKGASKKKWKQFWDIHGEHKDRIW